MTWDVHARPVFVALICAEGMSVIWNAKTLQVAFKNPDQRTPGERVRVSRGLFREFASEFLILVPVSVVLALVVLRPIVVLSRAKFFPGLPDDAIDGALGVISHRFPYVMVKQWALRWLAKILRSAADITDKNVLGETEEELREEKKFEGEENTYADDGKKDLEQRKRPKKSTKRKEEK